MKHQQPKLSQYPAWLREFISPVFSEDLHTTMMSQRHFQDNLELVFQTSRINSTNAVLSELVRDNIRTRFRLYDIESEHEAAITRLTSKIELLEGQIKRLQGDS